MASINYECIQFQQCLPLRSSSSKIISFLVWFQYQWEWQCTVLYCTVLYCTVLYCSLVSAVAGRGGTGISLAVVLRVGSAVCCRIHRLGLLETRPVGVGPGEGWWRDGWHWLHLEGEGGSSKERVMVMFGLLPLPRLDVVFLQSYRPWLTVDLLVETTGVTDHVSGWNN